jgi:cell division protease FtsH
MGRVKKVDLYENGTIAIVEAVSPELGNRVQRVRVQLPGTSAELLQKFRANKIDFAAHSEQEDGGAVFMNLLGNLAFPLLLVGGLFLLSRRSQVCPAVLHTHTRRGAFASVCVVLLRESDGPRAGL